LFPEKSNGTHLIDKRDFRSRLKKILGFRPGNIGIYEAAFIHRSASYSLSDGRRLNNERLEYLGDAVLDTILSDYLFKLFPEANEGFLTKIRSRIVNREVLNQVAISMGLNKLLISNFNSVQNSKNLCGDAFEALIGSVFIDKGYRKTKKMFLRRILDKYLDINNIINTDSDYKSLVFEWVQKNKAKLLFTYNEEYDFEQKKSVFATTLFINMEEYGKGQGTTKKEAEQEASCNAWKKIGENYNICEL